MDTEWRFETMILLGYRFMANKQKTVEQSPDQPEPAIDKTAMKIEMWSIDRPMPYANNARKWTAQDVEKVAMSIRQFGFRQPIVVDNRDEIVVGHLRLAGARLAGLKEVPVHIAGDLTEEQIKAYRLADNKLGEIAEWVPESLATDFLDLRIANFDISSTGFELDDIISSVFAGNGGGKRRKNTRDSESGHDESDKLPSKFQVLVDCDGENHQIKALEMLTAAGYRCKALL